MNIAADANFLHTAEMLVQYGADVNAQDDNGTTPLIMAACRNNSDITQMLLSHGANLNIYDRSFRSALCAAVQVPDGNHVIPILLAHGADLYQPDPMGRTPLQLAAEENHSKLLYWLKHKNLSQKYRMPFLNGLGFGLLSKNDGLSICRW